MSHPYVYTGSHIIIQYGRTLYPRASNSYFNNHQFGVSCVNYFYYKVGQLQLVFLL